MGSEEYQAGDLFPIPFGELVTVMASRLKECGCYQKLMEEESEISKKYPFFMEMMTMEGKNVHMTEEEHRAFVRYTELHRQMEYVKIQECYYIGQIHANILNKNLGERMNSDTIDSFFQWDSFEKKMWNHEEPSEYFKNLFKELQADSQKRVKKNPGYRKLDEEEQRLLEEHPFIQSMVYGDAPCGELQLSVKQQQALIDFMDICCKKATYTDLAIYEIGLKSCIEFFYMLF